MIKVTGAMIEALTEHQELLSKTMPVAITVTLTRAISKMREESKAYLEARETLMKKHKIKPNTDGKINILKHPEFLKELLELQAQKIELGMKKIDVNLKDLPDLSISEMEFIMPFLNIKENDNAISDRNS